MFGQIFMRGLLALLPTFITLSLLAWIFQALEANFRAPIITFIGEQYYFPGLSIVIALCITFVVGAVINTYMVQIVYAWGERQLKRIPLVKTLYGSISDMMSLFDKDNKPKEGKVVTVEVDGLRYMGLIMREDLDQLPEGLGKKSEVAVFLPLSYQVGGFTVFVPKKKVKPVNMSVENAIRFAASAGMTGVDLIDSKKKGNSEK